MKQTPLVRKTPLRSTSRLRAAVGAFVREWRSSSVKPRNAKRRSIEWLRSYGSQARVEWVASRACIVVGCLAGKCDNAHVIGGGGSRKADARFTAPICHAHHNELHDHGSSTFEAKYGLNLLDWAARTEAAWQHENSAALSAKKEE